jgi:tetratricopeptide (TPR) repeat protein/serine/threonine protein kinase
MPADLNKARELFLHAVGKLPAEQWEGYVAETCGPDAELQRQVMHLLKVHEEAGSFLERPAEGLGATGVFTPAPASQETAASEGPGTRIGPYKLLQPIGEGGMGTVWLAQQHQPVQRKVALKIIKAGLDSAQVIARFEAERQALALMDHPNIARVLDAGATASGRPYFVMELVKGQPITTYCDEHRLTPRQRLELFVAVAQAIQHAHQKGIIHRDLKPSNILVAPYDGQAVVKVIDFGIAKATGQPLTEKTLFTDFGAVVGTPEYMSPEQAELNNQDIDTRSDVYSLGVLLYELLTGTTPLDRKRLKKAAMLEVLRVIREEEPPRPSTRLSTTDELPTVAAKRGLEPRKLSGLVRGELDWIVMKALDKDRNRRYETANGFARDVQRYLADEPVQACPPSAWYRFRKFTRRNKAKLAVAVGVLLAVVVMASSIGWVVRDRAARQTALEQALTHALEETESASRRNRWPEASAALKRAEALLADGPCSEELRERVRQWRADLDLVARLQEARLQGLQVNLAESHFNGYLARPGYVAGFRAYGLDLATVTAAEAARRIRARPGEIQRAVVAALDHWIELIIRYKLKDRQELARLLALVRAVDTDPWRLALRAAAEKRDLQKLVDLAAAPDLIRQPAYTQGQLGGLLCVNGKLAEGLGVLRRAQQLHPGDFWISASLSQYTSWADPPGHEEAVRSAWMCVALQPENAGARLNLGSALFRQGKLEEAIAECREAIRLKQAYARAHENLGRALDAQGRLDEAIAAYREAIRLKKDRPETHYVLGNALRAKGLLDEAIAEHRKAIRLKQDYPEAHTNLGSALMGKDRQGEAIAAYRQAIRINKDCPEAHYNLGNALAAKGWLDKAIAEYREAIRSKKDFAEAHFNLGRALNAQGLLDETIAEYRKAIRSKKNYPEAHTKLGGALVDKGLSDEAIAELREAIRLKKDYPEAHYEYGRALQGKGLLEEADAAYREAIRRKKDFPEAHVNLGNTLRARGQLDNAIAEYGKAIRIKQECPEAHANLGLALHSKGRLDEAVAAYREAIRVKKNYVDAHVGLGTTLRAKGCLDEAIFVLRAAVRVDKDHAMAHSHLGHALFDKALFDKRRLGEAIVEFREAIRLKKDYPDAHNNLGAALGRQGRLEEAVAACKEAIRLKKDYPQAHYNLGNALRRQGRLDEAVDAFREAIRLNKDCREAHYNLGTALHFKGRLDEAIAAFREAIRHKQDDPGARRNLGLALQAKGRLDEAIAAFREAIRLKKDYPDAHNNLGTALYSKGRLDEAIVEFREAIRLKKDSPWAYGWLGIALTAKGQFDEAIAELREAIRLNPGYAAARDKLRETEQLARLARRLLAVLQGKDQFLDTAEALALAQFCQLPFRQQYAAAARCYAAAFAARPALAEDWQAGHRSRAAGLAALAAAGQGQDAAALDEKERTRLRRQALDWLRAEVTAWGRRLDQGADRAPAGLAQLQHWWNSPDLAGVREAEALARLPEAERQLWQALWGDVADTLARARRQVLRLKTK